MSMTQEEIEALMNDTEVSEPEDNIDDILAGVDGVVDDTPSIEENANIDDILAGIDGIVDDNSSSEPENIDDILAGIDGMVDESSSSEPENIDDILAGIDGMVDETSAPVVEEKPHVAETLEEKIDGGIFPLPSSDEHKIVNQLNQVAEDSEEKASQIFDVLSFILDENEKVEATLNASNKFIDSQIELLTKLTNKFPQIKVLQEQLDEANAVKTKYEGTSNVISEENNKIFEAMEIMQYHDINRQKIERVMSVIRKLTTYLNGIFEDDSTKPEVQIAKHISGDSSTSMNDDDLDSLISEFSKD